MNLVGQNIVGTRTFIIRRAFFRCTQSFQRAMLVGNDVVRCYNDIGAGEDLGI